MVPTLQDAITDLVAASLDCDWDAIRQAQQALLTVSVGKDATLLDLSDVFTNPRLMAHCAHCGLQLTSHDALTRKCLFESTYFKPCPVKLSGAAHRAALSGNWIGSIKEMRAALGLGLREAKDLMEVEFNRHNWKK
jgi:hypothetical protein